MDSGRDTRRKNNFLHFRKGVPFKLKIRIKKCYVLDTCFSCRNIINAYMIKQFDGKFYILSHGVASGSDNTMQ